MAKYREITIDGVTRYRFSDTLVVVPDDPTNPAYQDLQTWLSEGGIADPERTTEEQAEIDKQASLNQIDADFDYTLSQPVECVVSGSTYIMNGKETSAVRMKHGIDIAELTGQTTMNVVGFYNNVYANVPMAVCHEIMKQQAVYYLTAYMTRAVARDTLLNG